MKGRNRILIGLALLGGLVAWWALGERRPAGDAAVAREKLSASEREDSRTLAVEEALAGATERVERERVREALEVAPVVTHRFVGRVVDETRHPVSGARVELRWNELEPPSASCGRDGRFALEAALGGEAYLGQAFMWARGPRGRGGHVLAAFPRVIAGEVIEVELGTIGLTAAHALRVRVVEGGTPVGGATVCIALGHERNRFDERETDERGEVVFDGIEPGPVHLTAHAPGREGSLEALRARGDARLGRARTARRRHGARGRRRERRAGSWRRARAA